MEIDGLKAILIQGSLFYGPYKLLWNLYYHDRHAVMVVPMNMATVSLTMIMAFAKVKEADPIVQNNPQ